MENQAPEQPGQFVGAMQRWREQMGLGHNAFARYLGISHSLWSAIHRGRRRVSRDVAGRVLRERPELGYYWTHDLSTSDNHITPMKGGGER